MLSPPPLATKLASQPTAMNVPMPSGLVVVFLATLLGIQPITTDLYLPALPALTSSFSAPMSQAQLTLSALMLAFGVSQLVCRSWCGGRCQTALAGGPFCLSACLPTWLPPLAVRWRPACCN